MVAGRFSSPLRAVGVLAMPGARLDTTRHGESVCKLAPGVVLLQRLVHGVVLEVFIDRSSVADGVEVTR
jgi:hypothetical protein